MFSIPMGRSFDRKPLPENDPFVKALEKYVADGRKSELIRKLERNARSFGRSTVVTDSQIYAQIAIDDLNKDNYRSPYLESALRDVGESFYEDLIGGGKLRKKESKSFPNPRGFLSEEIEFERKRMKFEEEVRQRDRVRESGVGSGGRNNLHNDF